MRQKLATYSLALDHRRGGPKAVLFERLLGITLDQLDYLEAEIRRGAAIHPVSRAWDTPYGRQCTVRIPVRGVGIHHGNVMVVTTGWQLRYVGDQPRLVSAYIKGKRAK